MNKKGQVMIEYILLVGMLIFLFSFISSQFQDQNVLARLVSGPWSQLQGMIENGVWGTPQATKGQHPGHLLRHVSHIN